MINGQLAPDFGGYCCWRQDIAGLTPRDIWRLGVGRTFQIAATFGSMTVVENVQMALLSHARRAFSTVAAGGNRSSRARARIAGAGRHGGSRRPAEPRTCLWRRQARRACHRARQRSAPVADGRADRRHGAAGAQRTDASWSSIWSRRQSRCCSPSIRWMWCSLIADRIIVLASRPADRVTASCARSAIIAGAGGLLRHGQDVCPEEPRHAGNAILTVQGLNAWYGGARILYDWSSRSAAAKWWR